MKRLEKGLSLVLTVVLLLGVLAPAALAAENTITIRTVEDLIELSRSCTLDSWSRDKTVILENDLDLRDTAFAPIPTFGGSFQGNGHKISGLNLTGSGNVRGLFRYIQSGAAVQHLTVEGTIHPNERQDELGLLAGSNAGRIIACSGIGIIVGDNRIGGLVGVNEAGGEMVGCTFSGSVTGKHSVGGIVGENHGTLTRCENNGSINTKDLEDNPKTDYTDLANLNSMENIPAYTDVGGVVGLSDGTVQSCVNHGTVGYDQIGYNIGGVAGRQSGWLDGCSNTGTVSGRKDVGGIVGQLEPDVLKTFSEDFLDRLLDQLDALQNVMDSTANHADGISDSVHAQLNDLSDKAREVKELAGDLTDAMTDWANGNIDQINELSARVSWSLDQLDDIMDDMEKLTDDLDTLLNRLEKVRGALEDAADSGGDAAEALKAATEKLREANAALAEALPGITAATVKVIAALQGNGDLMEALEELTAALQGLNGAVIKLDEALAKVAEALGDLSGMSDDIKRALELMDNVHKAAQKAVDHLSDVTDGLSSMIHELAEMPEIKIEPIGEDVTGTGDQLQEAMDALLDSADALNQLLSDSADTLIGDLKAINSQFRAITNLIRSEKADWDSDQDQSLEDRIRDHFQDVSEDCTAENQHDGRISNSENQGEIYGNTNVGGIVGSVGIEADFDSDDVTKVGDYSLDFHYQARALILGCTNNGEVAVRNDYAGGIVGRLFLGRLTDSEAYGPVKADGSYAGGIAGSAERFLDGSWSKCTVSGKDYAGGIAGYAETLTDCHSLAEVTGNAYVGAIAGGVSDDAELADNTFTHEFLGGVDGISYAGKAEPVSFDALCASENVPSAFARLELTFRADGKVLAVIPFQYGRGIDSLPEIPAKKGCSAAWPELDYTNLTASQTLDAVYTPYSSALSDGGALPEILVDGSFSKSAEVTHTSSEVSWTDAKGTVHTGTAVTVEVNDPDLKEISYTVHYRLPESGKHYTLWVETENGWEQQESKVDGSYLLFPSSADSVTFCVQEREANKTVVFLLAGAAAILLLLVLVVVIRKKRGNRNSRSGRLRRIRTTQNK